MTDPLVRQVSFEYDAADRVIQQELPGGRTVLFDWDESGNLVSLTPPGQPAHLFDYTPVDLPAIYEPPDVGIGTVATDYSWNLDRNPDTITRPDGAQISFAYDIGQRPVSITSPRGTQTITWEPNRGRIQRVTTPEGVALSYLYDGPLVTRTTWSGGGITGQVNRTYDDDLRLRTIAVNGANAVAYSYDADSLLRQAGSLVLNRDPETGLLTGTTLGNVTTSYAYNGFGELASMTASFGATPLYAETYTRDALGRIVTRVETIQGVTTTYEYGYDAAGRLETVTKNGTLASQYAYDANGNRLAKQTPTTTETGTYDAQDRMLTYAGASYTYTANGETLTKTDSTGTATYQYDVFGNLLGVDLPNGTQIRYKVDGRNRRIERSVNGVVTQRWLWQGQLSPIAELSASNAVVSRFVYATQINVPDYLVRSGATYRILHDHLGSPRLAVNATTGAVAQRMDFDEWGIVTTDTNPAWQPFGFAGGLLERESGLTRMGAREVDPSIGRWSTKDPIGVAGGSTGFYRYASNEPTNLVDPTGLDTYFFGIAGAGAGPGGGATASIGIAINLGLNGERIDLGVFGTAGVASGLDASGAIFGGTVQGDIGNLRGSTTSLNLGGGPFSGSVIRDAESGERIGATFGVGPSFPPLNGSISREETWLFSVGDLTDGLLELWKALFGPDMQPEPVSNPDAPGPCDR